MVIFSAFALGMAADSRLLAVGNGLWNVGGLGTLVLGIWLALYLDGYEIWDGWIITALVLFAIATELGRRAQLGYTPAARAAAGAATRRRPAGRPDALAALARHPRPARGDDLQAGGVTVAVGAPIRPDAWDFPLLLHVLGAMLLVGTLVLAASALILAWRDGSASLVRLGYRSLLIGALPAWIVMRGAAEWIADKEGLTGDEVPSWVDIGYSTADSGFLLLVISTVLAGLAVRRAGRSRGRPGGGFSRASTVIVSLALIAYLVAIWAMTTQPV